MRSGIVAIDAAAENGHRRAARVEGTAMRLAVHAAGETAHHQEPGGGELPTEHPRNAAAVRRARTCADDRHRRPREKRRIGDAPEEEPSRRVVDRREERRVGGIGAGEEADAATIQVAAVAALVEGRGKPSEAPSSRSRDDVRVRGGGERGESELCHAAISRGVR